VAVDVGVGVDDDVVGVYIGWRMAYGVFGCGVGRSSGYVRQQSLNE